MVKQKSIITSDDILGKETVDAEGEILGVVAKLHIDKSTKKMLGITIDQGFMKPDLYIGMHHVKTFGIDAIFISRTPPDKYKGLKVLTNEGKLIGTVKEVNTKRQKIESMVCRPTGISFNNDFIIAPSQIEEMGISIVMKKGFKKKAVKK